jgi:hypothetical protein
MVSRSVSCLRGPGFTSPLKELTNTSLNKAIKGRIQTKGVAMRMLRKTYEPQWEGEMEGWSTQQNEKVYTLYS